MIYNPLKTDVKTSIILVLSKHYPKSARELYKFISEKNKVSYQYIHKAVKELVNDGILDENNKEYTLNTHWLKELQEFIDEVDINYKLDYKIFSRKVNTVVLDCFSEQEKKNLSQEIEQVISDKATTKMNEWYSGFYDPEHKEFSTVS